MKSQSLVTVLRRDNRVILIIPLWIILLRHPDYAHWPPKILEAAINGKAIKP